MAKIGDTFERDGATYTVVFAEESGPNTQKPITPRRARFRRLYRINVLWIMP